jgi:hypothetical protein
VLIEFALKGKPMKALILNVCIAVMFITAGYLWGSRSTPVVHAQQAGKSIPKAFGKVIGTMGGEFVFEDSSGTIRLVETVGPQVTQTYTRN